MVSLLEGEVYNRRWDLMPTSARKTLASILSEEGITRKAAGRWDESLIDQTRSIWDDAQVRMQGAFERLLPRLEKFLAKQNLVLNRNGTQWWNHGCGGSGSDGFGPSWGFRLVIIDKEDHQRRDKHDVKEALFKAGLTVGDRGLKDKGGGEWEVSYEFEWGT